MQSFTSMMIALLIIIGGMEITKEQNNAYEDAAGGFCRIERTRRVRFTEHISRIFSLEEEGARRLSADSRWFQDF